MINLVANKYPSQTYENIKMINFSLSDTPTAELVPVIREINKIIEFELKANRGVLVYCFKGISRAPSVIMAFLMEYRKMSFDSAFDLIRAASPNIDPNAGFMMQLMNFMNNQFNIK